MYTFTRSCLTGLAEPIGSKISPACLYLNLSFNTFWHASSLLIILFRKYQHARLVSLDAKSRILPSVSSVSNNGTIHLSFANNAVNQHTLFTSLDLYWKRIQQMHQYIVINNTLLHLLNKILINKLILYNNSMVHHKFHPTWVPQPVKCDCIVEELVSKDIHPITR